MLNILEKRIIELSYKNKLTHVSSCLNTVNALDAIDTQRKVSDPVIVANCHASLAHYVVLEHRGYCNAQTMIEKHGVHAHRDMENGIWVSGGSLGQSEPIAVGMALADRTKDVWLVTSDGGCAEGSVWEAFRIASELKLTNLKVHLIANGFGAYGPIDVEILVAKLALFLAPLALYPHYPKMPFPWLEGLAGHYLVLNEQQYAEATK